MVRPGEVVTRQSSRNEGPLSGSSGLLRKCHWSSRDSDVRQLDSRGVRQQTRGHDFPGSVFVDQPPSEMDRDFDVHLDARYLPGENNVLAEVLSRRGQVVGTEWSLHPQVARSLLRAWGNPLIDLFATSLNAKLPLYCSLVPDPQAVFEEAFRHLWDDLDLYAFPPFPLVGRVIARVRESSRVAMTLAAPLWPEKEWFADLLLLLTQPPLALPWWDSLLRQPHCNLFHQGVHASNLHAWQHSQVSLPKVGLFGKGCSSLVRVPPGVFLSIIPVEMADLLWLVSWKGRCSSQRHCSSSRGLADPPTPGQGLVRLCG